MIVDNINVSNSPTVTGMTYDWSSRKSARWKDMLARECRKRGDKFSTLVMTLTKEELEITFDDDFGGIEGCPFTAWSENWVYFPVQYDGSEWVGSVPRNPCDIKTEHIGG